MCLICDRLRKLWETSTCARDVAKREGKLGVQTSLLDYQGDDQPTCRAKTFKELDAPIQHPGILTLETDLMSGYFRTGVTPTSPHTFVIAAGLLGGAALTAALVPTRRAGRTDPIIALRLE